MCRLRAVILAFLILPGVLLPATVASAADSWVEVKTSQFTVISNGGESRARNVAWQFEQIRGAIEKGWPWAKVKLDRPVVVVALKDEGSMKAMAPWLWEGRNRDATFSSVFATAPDRYYVLLRADLVNDDRDSVNPYQSAYWSYSSVILRAAFGRALPLWLANGLAHVLSNSIVRKNEIHFGLPLPEYVRSVQSDARLRLPQLITITPTSPYFTDPLTRVRFDAQSWGFVQFLLFATPDAADRLNRMMRLILTNTPSEAALTESYGDLEQLERSYLGYLRNGIFKYSRLLADSDVAKQKYPTRVIPPAAAAAMQAGVYAAANRPVEFRARLDESRKADAGLPATFEIEGFWLELQGQRDEAQSAYEKAIEQQSDNFYTYYRLAALRGPQANDAAGVSVVTSLLDRAIALNPDFAPALAYRSDIHERQNHLAQALDFAQRAVRADQTETIYWIHMAQILARIPRVDDARQVAQNALKYADNDRDRAALQDVLDSLARPGASAAPAAARAPGSLAAPSLAPTTAAPAQAPPASNPVGTVPATASGQPAGATDIQAPRVRKRVNPVVTAGGVNSKGTVIMEIHIAPDGHVADAKVESPPSSFDAAALDAIRQWEYEPTLVNGKPVTIIMKVVLNFGY